MGDPTSREKMDALQKDFLETLEFPELQECVTAYLRVFPKYGVDNMQSKHIFFGVTAMAVHEGDGYYAYKVRFWIDSPGVWASALTPDDQARLKNDWIRPKERLARILDDVKFAYFKQHGKDPDLQALRTFYPLIDSEQLSLLDSALNSCENSTVVQNIDSFSKSFDVLSDLLRAQRDLLSLVTLIQRMQKNRRVTWSVLRQLLYLYAVGVLFVKLVPSRPLAYKDGVSKEEFSWLLSGESPNNRYFHDYLFQLEYAIFMRRYDGFSEMCKGQALLHIYANEMDMTLTPIDEAAAVIGLADKAWKKNPDAVRKVRIHITDRFGKPASLRVGQTLGNVFILWWDDKRKVAYVQLKELDRVVLEAGIERLTKTYNDDSFYGEVYRRTEHLLELIPLMFEVIMYIPDLYFGGLKGLLESVVFNFAVAKTAEAFGINENAIQLMILGAGLLRHGFSPRKNGAQTMEMDTPMIEKRGLGRHTENSGISNRLADSAESSLDRSLDNRARTGSVPDISEGKPPAVSVEMRGVRTGDQTDSIMIRPATELSHLTQQEVTALKNTEANLLERRAKLEREWRQQKDIARSIGDRADLVADNATKQRLENAFDAQQKRADNLEAQLGALNEALAHVQARIAREAPPAAQSPHLARGRLREAEVAEAFNLGPKNNLTLKNPDPTKPNFNPDHIEGNPGSVTWGRSYHFKEIKDWTKMKDTGNLSAMLDYVENTSGSRLTIYYRNGTYMTGPLRTRIEGLMKSGKVDLIPFVGELLDM